MSSKKILLSAMQPTRQLTLGNYLGALRNWVHLQQNYRCYFSVVDLHSITQKQDPQKLRDQIYFLVATYLAGGVDPAQCTIFAQSHVPEHTELAWVLMCHSTMGELSRMTQFKDKSAKHKQIPTGIFIYPVLMAADILLYRTELVPVGQDQKQHIELTRDLALRMNGQYGEDLFVVPEPYIPPVGAKIMSLQNPEAKMSKSDEDSNGTVYLSDSNADILKKLKRAVTDSGTEITFDDQKPGVKNLLMIQAALSGKFPEELVTQYVGKQYGHLKIETAEIICAHLGPMRDRINTYLNDKAELDRILKRGAERAREKAAQTLATVYDRLGFVPRGI